MRGFSSLQIGPTVFVTGIFMLLSAPLAARLTTLIEPPRQWLPRLLEILPTATVWLIITAPVWAAILAQLGMTGPPQPFEGVGKTPES